LTTAAAVVGAILVAGAIGAGLYLWLPTRGDPDHRGGLGSALIGGAVIALAIFLVQIVIDERRQRESEQTNLRLTLGLTQDLGGIDLRGEDLDRVYLAGKSLVGALLEGASLSGANLSGARLRDAHLSGANLRCGNLNLARIPEARFNETDLTGASLQGVSGEDAQFFGADLRSADLSRAALPQSKLIGADLTEAYLNGADLRTADLTDANLTDVHYDGETRWPEGFTPPPPGPESTPDPCA
jgi:hypothetical protein